MKKKKNLKVKSLVVSPTFEKHRGFSLEKAVCNVVFVSGLLQILALFSLPYVWYKPCDRPFNSDNLFSENQVIVSEEEKQDILRTLEKELGIVISDNEENYLLLHAVMENPYLSSKEKEVFYKFIEYFNDNPYINREEIYKNILNVNARFSLRAALQKKENVLAIYLPDYRDIIYFQLFPSVDTMAHEDGHCINDNKKMPNCIVEGIDQIISSEYFSETPFVLTTSYPYEVSFVKLLFEMIGTDTVLQAYTEDNPELIYEALDNLVGEKGKAKGVMEDLNWCFKNYSKNKFLTDEEEEKVANTLLAVLNYINNFEYQDKEAVQYHLSVFINFFTNQYGTLDEYCDIVLCKAYLSSKLKSEWSSNSITVKKDTYLGYLYKK